MSDLDRPAAPDELYLARAGEVEACRPILTGDVFEDIAIPGVDEPGMAMVIAHPCSMRQGAHLRSHVPMARVVGGPPIALGDWPRGHFGVMPLPDLTSSGNLAHRAVFELAGRVPTASLNRSSRVACLDATGVLLLLQRLTFSLTRLALPLDRLLSTIAPILEEADLLEEWTRARAGAAPAGGSEEIILRSEVEFEELMSRELNGTKLRSRLLDPKQRASVRRAVLAELAGAAS